jgi:hypothetical protein
MRVLAFFLISVAAIAQIERPRLGWMLDGNAALRPVYGIAATATLGDPAGDAAGDAADQSIIGFACSSLRCVVKSDGAVAVYDPASQPGNALGGSFNTANAPEGAALIALDAAGAFLYFPQTSRMARWNLKQRKMKNRAANRGAAALEYFDFSPVGEVLALRTTLNFTEAAGFDYAVRRDDGVWMEHFSRSDGSVTVKGAIYTESTAGNDAANDTGSGQPDPVRAVALLENGYVAASDSAIAIVRSDGTRRDFPVPAVNAFFAMSSDYVEAVTGNGNWVVCVTAGRESANLLPGVSQ